MSPSHFGPRRGTDCNITDCNINGVSDAVRGCFTLVRDIHIHTVSGAVDVDVQLSNGPFPAKITISTVSGAINLRTQMLEDTPSSNFTVSLQSVSGSINADVHHDVCTSFKSTSGTINADIHPMSPATPSTIDVTKTSGPTTLILHPSFLKPALPLHNITTDLRGTSGRAKFIFTSRWEGTITYNTTSGKYSYDWPGLQVENQGKSMVANYGEGKSRLNVNGTSMSADFEQQHFPEEQVTEPVRPRVENRYVDVGRPGGESSTFRDGSSTIGGASITSEGERTLLDEDWEMIDEPPSYKEAMKQE